MSKITRYLLILGTAALVLFACIGPVTPTPAPILPNIPRLIVQPTNATTPFSNVGQVITYSYSVANVGSTPLAGPVSVSDDKTTPPDCLKVNAVGNLDNNLDPNESVTCTSSYTIVQGDLNTGSVTSNAIAKVGAVDSNRVPTVVNMTVNRVLVLTISANPTTYTQVGQTITYTYSIKNTGTTALGPAQFVVKDDRVDPQLECGAPTTILPVNESVTCSAPYLTTQNDVTNAQLTNTATASGGGAVVAQPGSVTIANATPITPTSQPTGYTPGSTIQHTVLKGEWMIQIARCWGADYNEVRAANLQIKDPGRIAPNMLITVPHIGSKGSIYFPQCFESYTVQSGDTWDSIAQKYRADAYVLQAANWNLSLTNGTVIRVPRGTTPTSGSPQPTSIRITFPAGSTTFSQAGSVAAQSRVRYALNAVQGQLLSVKVTGPANEIALGISAPNGAALKAQDAALTWSGIVPLSGDYLIDIVAILGSSSKLYNLEVSLTSPVSSTFERVADINTGAGNSDPAYLTTFNGALYFRATGSDNAGAELWKYDINLKAASRVADINGAGGSDPSFLTVYNSLLYFRANGNDGAGVELWRFNGSSPGRMAEINLGIGDSNPAYLAVLGNALYFSAKGNDNAGVELWKTDGNTVARVADIHPGSGDSNPSHLVVFNNALYFSAVSNDTMGVELWRYDGVNLPARVLDINAGVGNSNPSYLTVFNNLLYFGANGNDNAGTELWKFDGTNASRAADINVGAGDSGPAFLTVFNGALYFSANGNDGAGTELWKYDGTTARRVSDINTSGNTNPAYLYVFNNELYFQANGNDGAGTELWKFKGP
jgi:uncharacterized repeat protein (TIGR01451 family)